MTKLKPNEASVRGKCVSTSDVVDIARLAHIRTLEKLGCEVDYVATDQHIEEGNNYDLALIEMESPSSVVEMVSEIKQRSGNQVKIVVMVKETVPFEMLQSWKKIGVDCVAKQPIPANIIYELLGEEVSSAERN